jgi:glucose-1-phosphate thymidylyltransferase
MFAYYVNEPSQYGVVKFDDAGEPVDLVEKPTQFVSNWAVTGLYFYDNAVSTLPPDYARLLAANWRLATSIGATWS